MNQATAKVIFFGPGLAAAGVRAQAYFGPSLLFVLAECGQFDLPVDSLSLSNGGFDSQQLLIRSQRGNDVYTLSPVSEGDRNLLINQAPSSVAQELSKLGKQDKALNRRFKITAISLGLIISLPFLAFGIFVWQFPLISNLVLEFVPIEAEKPLGELVKASVTGNLIEKGPAVDAIKKIGQRLSAGSKYQYQWYLSKDSSVNAFAAPGGIVVVNLGLIRFVETPEELAGVLAHEIQHIELRHSLKGIVYQFGISVLWALVVGDFSAWGGLASDLFKLDFSRSQESEADLYGLQALKKAQISPEGMIKFFSKLDAGNISLPAFLSTHPSDEERKEKLLSELKALGTWEYKPLEINWLEVKASLAN